MNQEIIYSRIFNLDTTITVYRYVCLVDEGGNIIAKGDPNVHTITPIDDYSNEDPGTIAMCDAMFTEEVKQAYRDKMGE